jgi:tripartite-type tricarboxylate transporter receptor subunit TctC
MLDTLPRMIAEKLTVRWGQPFIVENRPGAAQNLGAEAVAKAEPDGHTLLVSPPGPLAVSQHFYPKLGFDPSAFVPVTQLIAFPHLVLASPQLGISTLPELISLAKANPSKLSYGSPGLGSTPQLAMEKFLHDAGIRMIHVPYQGMGPAQRDLIAGHIHAMFDAPGNALPHIANGQLRAFAVTGDRRIAELPDVPTVSETVPGFLHMEWFTVVAPPKTPANIADRLSNAMAETLALPDIAQRLRNFAVTPVGSSPIDAAAFIRRESERWRQIIVVTGIQMK